MNIPAQPIRPPRYASGEFSVIFLTDALPPRAILLLKRGADREFRPEWYTGLGGKVEAGETTLEGAYRELKEEVGLHVPLHCFARAIVQEKIILSYYHGIVPPETPLICSEGSLHWTPVSALLRKKIIPATKEVLREWKRRSFQVSSPWELVITEG